MGSSRVDYLETQEIDAIKSPSWDFAPGQGRLVGGAQEERFKVVISTIRVQGATSSGGVQETIEIINNTFHWFAITGTASGNHYRDHH